MAENSRRSGQIVKRGKKWVVRVFLGHDEMIENANFRTKTIRGTKKVECRSE